MVEIVAISGLARLLLRGDATAAVAAGTAFGVAIPRAACRAEAVPPRAALWLGPDEILLLFPREDLAATQSALATALAGHPHALVDISHRQQALRIAGANAAALLNAGCPLDLDLAVFPANACTRTLFGKAEVVLWRVADGAFHLEVARSYSPYVTALLHEAAGGLA